MTVLFNWHISFTTVYKVSIYRDCVFIQWMVDLTRIEQLVSYGAGVFKIELAIFCKK